MDSALKGCRSPPHQCYVERGGVVVVGIGLARVPESRICPARLPDRTSPGFPDPAVVDFFHATVSFRSRKAGLACTSSSLQRDACIAVASLAVNSWPSLWHRGVSVRLLGPLLPLVPILSL